MSLRYEHSSEALHISVKHFFSNGELYPGSDSPQRTCVAQLGCGVYRGTSLIRNSLLVEPYSRTMSRALWWPQEGRVFLMSEIPL